MILSRQALLWAIQCGVLTVNAQASGDVLDVAVDNTAPLSRGVVAVPTVSTTQADSGNGGATSTPSTTSKSKNTWSSKWSNSTSSSQSTSSKSGPTTTNPHSTSSPRVTPSPRTSIAPSDCSSLSPNEAVTIWEILPNPNTVIVTIFPNASMPSLAASIPEFTPPTYCTQTEATTDGHSVTFLIPVGTSEIWGVVPSANPTTTVITTSKNPVTEFTTPGGFGYPGSGTTDKQPNDPDSTDVSWTPLGPPTGRITVPIVTIGPGGQPLPTGGGNGPGDGSSGNGNNGNGNGNGNGSNPPPSITVGGVPVSVDPTKVVIGTQTVAVPGSGGGGSGNGNGNGNSPTVITEGGQVFTINPSQVIGAGTAINLPPNSGAIFIAAPESTVIAGVPVQLGQSIAVIAGATYAIGPGAPQETIVVNGQTISIGPGGLGFAQTTVAPPAGQPTNVVIVDGQLISAIGSSVAVIDGTTYTYGSGTDAKTINLDGEIITIGPGGIYYDGKTVGGTAHPTGTQLVVAGGLSVTEIGSTIAVVSSMTFTIGPRATPTTTVINGHTITFGPAGVGLGSTTLSYPFNPTTKVITAGGITLTEIGASLVVIGGTTFTIGPGAKTTTDIYDGQTISLGPGGVGFATTTVAAAGATPTSAASATTKKKNDAAGVLKPMSGVLGACILLSVAYMI